MKLRGQVGGKRRAATVAHLLHVHAVVGGGGEAEVNPHEGAHAALLPGWKDRTDLKGLAVQQYGLARPKPSHNLVAQVVERTGLQGRGKGTVILAADDDRRAAKLVAAGVNPLGGEDKDTAGALHLLLHVEKPVADGGLGGKKGGGNLSGAYLAVDQLRKVDSTMAELLLKSLLVGDEPNHRDAKGAKFARDIQRLGICV